MNVTKVEYESNAIELINSLGKLSKETLQLINLTQDINDKILVKTHFTEGKGKNSRIHTQVFDYHFFEVLIKNATPEFLDYSLTEWTKKYPLKIENFSNFLSVLFAEQNTNKIDVAFKYLKEFKQQSGRDLTYHISNIINREGYALGLGQFLMSNKELKLEEFKPIWNKYLVLNSEVLGFTKVAALPGIFSTMLSREQYQIANYVIEEMDKMNKEIPPILAHTAFEYKALDLFKNIVDIHSNKKPSKEAKKDKEFDLDAWEEKRLYEYQEYGYNTKNSFDSVYELFLNLALNNGKIENIYFEMLGYLDTKKLVKLDYQNAEVILATKILLANYEGKEEKIEEYLEKTFKYFKKTGLKNYLSLLESCNDFEQEQKLLMPLLNHEKYKNEFSSEFKDLAQVKLYDYLKSNGEVDQIAEQTMLNLATYIDNKKEVFKEVSKTPLREKLLLEIEVKTQDLKVGKRIKL